MSGPTTEAPEEMTSPSSRQRKSPRPKDQTSPTKPGRQATTESGSKRGPKESENEPTSKPTMTSSGGKSGTKAAKKQREKWKMAKFNRCKCPSGSSGIPATKAGQGNPFLNGRGKKLETFPPDQIPARPLQPPPGPRDDDGGICRLVLGHVIGLRKDMVKFMKVVFQALGQVSSALLRFH